MHGAAFWGRPPVRHGSGFGDWGATASADVRRSGDRLFRRSVERPKVLRIDKGIHVERTESMNPADVAQSALPVAAVADVSLFALFWQAHWIVKAVMLGLMACSVWVWAIAIDKIFMYARAKRAMDRFEQAFWSGQSIEELYRALSGKPTQSMAALFVAAM